jgi:peptidoglycan/LPS O-acetylase OafA/YrhL
MPRDKTSNYLPSLDGWRALAILAVMVCHGFGLREAPAGWPRILNGFVLNLGQQGVSLFFAISGYLITSLLLAEHRRNGVIDLGGFYIRRVCRILPPAYFYLFALALLAAGGFLKLAPGELASGFFMYNNYWPSRSWYTQHFWSLSMEEHFYLGWPLLLTRLGSRPAAWAAAALIAATLLWRPWALQNIPSTVTALQRTDMRLDAFLFAALLAIILHDHPDWRYMLTARRHALLVAVLVGVYAYSLVFPAQLMKLFWQSALMPFILVPTIFLGPSYWVARWLEHPILGWFGQISYSLYLWQQLIFHSDAPDFQTAAVWFLPRLALVIALAAGSHHALERPFMRLGRRWANSRGTARQALSQS